MAFGAESNATGLSAVLDGAVPHDQITRFLAGAKRTSAELWRVVKPHVHRIQSVTGVLISDDSIAEKPSINENDISCWRYDHTQHRTVKGINFVSAAHSIDRGDPATRAYDSLS